MKILSIAPDMPCMQGPGATSRYFCMLRELSQKHSFTILTTEQTFNDRIPALESLGIEVEVVSLGHLNEASMVFRSLKDNYYTASLDRIFFQKPREVNLYQGARVHMARVIEERLNEGYDLLEVQHSWCAQWIEGLKIDIPKILIFIDVVSLLYQRLYEQKRLKMQKLEAFFAWRKMTRYERRVIKQFDKFVVLSQNELEALEALVPDCDAAIVPNGVDIEYFNPMESLPVEPNSLVFTGTMNWFPNEDAVLWFCGEVLPLIRREYPNVKLNIVGTDPPPSITALHDGKLIIVTGRVRDVRSYIAQSAVDVVPIRVGAGTRIKILEAMAMGKAVVSTFIGCEGLEVTDGENILIADRPEDFSDCVCRLLREREFAKSLGRSGRRLVEERYSYSVLAPKMDKVYEEVVSGR